MIEFALALLSTLSQMPGLLLALALAPRLVGRAVILLAILDLWLLLEVLETLARPAYVVGSQAVPRLIACASQIALAIALFRGWQRLRPAGSAPEPIPLRPLLTRRPIRSGAGSLRESRAA